MESVLVKKNRPCNCIEITRFFSFEAVIHCCVFDGTGGSNRVFFTVLVCFFLCFESSVSSAVKDYPAKTVANKRKILCDGAMFHGTCSYRIGSFSFYCISVLNVENMFCFAGNTQLFQIKTLL